MDTSFAGTERALSIVSDLTRYDPYHMTCEGVTSVRDVNTHEWVQVREPAEIVREMLGLGMDKNCVMQTVLAYYTAVCGRQKSVDNAEPKPITPHALRGVLWREERMRMPDEPGYCYLSVVRWSRRDALKKKLGAYPLFWDFLSSLSDGDLFYQYARTCRMFLVAVRETESEVYHIGTSHPFALDVGSFYDILYQCLLRRPTLNPALMDSGFFVEPGMLTVRGDYDGHIGTTTADAVVRQGSVAQVAVSGRGVAPVVRETLLPPTHILPAKTLENLRTMDFTTCKCAVHKQPSAEGVGGCSQVDCGYVGPVRAAASGDSYVCAVDEPTRLNDQKFLRFLCTAIDPGTLDGKRRSRTFQNLCSSRSTYPDWLAFGRGYCYLQLMHQDSWWRLARVLGPNPRVTSVLRAMLWVGVAEQVSYEFVSVAPGVYHVASLGGEKRVDGGRRAYRVLHRLCQEQGDPVIGSDASDVSSGDEHSCSCPAGLHDGAFLETSHVALDFSSSSESIGSPSSDVSLSRPSSADVWYERQLELRELYDESLRAEIEGPELCAERAALREVGVLCYGDWRDLDVQESHHDTVESRCGKETFAEFEEYVRAVRERVARALYVWRRGVSDVSSLSDNDTPRMSSESGDSLEADNG